MPDLQKVIPGNKQNSSLIKDNYQAMYDKWQEYSKTSFYIGK